MYMTVILTSMLYLKKPNETQSFAVHMTLNRAYIGCFVWPLNATGIQMQ